MRFTNIDHFKQMKVFNFRKVTNKEYKEKSLVVSHTVKTIHI